MNDPIDPRPLEPGTAAPASGGFARVLRVFFEPGKVFSELNVKPSFVWALIVLVAATFSVQAVVSTRLDMESIIRAQMSERSQGRQLNEDQLASAMKFATIAAKVGMFAAPLAVPLVFLALAGIYLALLKVLGSQVDFNRVFAVTTHAAVPPTVVGAVIGSLVALSKGAITTSQEAENLLKSSLGAVLPEGTNAMVRAAAGVLDIFNVWQWILLAIGLTIVGRVTRGKAVAAIAVVWGIWLVIKVGLAALR